MNSVSASSGARVQGLNNHKEDVVGPALLWEERKTEEKKENSIENQQGFLLEFYTIFFFELCVYK